ncbi:hypothetical protein QGN31_23350 [Mycobacterium sp. 2-64]|uniref:hypothetical protein n=1 Tax=Mycobacterium sp. 2-64 TaxID=3042319 RepID=UPI002DDBD558|nr:hypothetical protein [Mycobacterium sp. 2-64]WSE51008.1 hypothetical protein QGN31_23350 [Mycobacterium sp. 2-64]
MDPLKRALTALAYYPSDEPIGQPITFHADWDKATIRLGSPGLFDGLVIAQWADA